MSTIAYDWIAHHARFAPDSPAMTDVWSDRAFSYAQMNDRVARLATVLRQRFGVERGDRVSMIAMNATEHFEMMFACQRLGAIFLPLNWRLAQPELDFIVNDARPRALLYGSDFSAQALALQSLIPASQQLRFDYGGASPYEDALAQATPLADPVDVTLDETWLILYTSGTTGRPKGALITYGMILFSSINSIQKLEITASSRGLTVMPLFHAGGLFLFATFIFHMGGSNFVMRSFDAARTLTLMADRALAVSHLILVPTQFIMMSELPEFAEADITHVGWVTVGGAAAPLALLEKYLAKGIVLQQGWGMTETAAMATVLSKRMSRDKLGSCGLPVLHTRMRIVDPSGADLPAGQTGELLIKGPTVTPGYWNRPEESAKSFTDGWLRTGDACQFDEEGYLYVVDRIKDMYISGGENVYPLEVENVLHRIPGVVEAAVIGVTDPKWGEVGRAFIVLREPGSITESQVLSHCEASLARYKIPKQVRFVSELPHNATGKLLKHALPRD